MKELWELYTYEKKRSGLYYDKSAGEPIPNGLYHNEVEVWVKNEKNEILITQRHPCQKCPLMWENARGSVYAGEDATCGAARILFEKTAIAATKNNLIYLGETVYENSFMSSYLYHMKDSGMILHLQPNKAIEARYITFDILDDLEEELVPEVWQRYKKYRDKIKIL